MLDNNEMLYNDQVLVRLIYDAFIKENVPTTYCICIDKTFCWFNVGKNRLENIGSFEMKMPTSSYTLGKFANMLRYQLVSSGVSLNNIVFYSYGDFILSDTFLSHRDLKYIFDDIVGLNKLSLMGIYERLIDTVLLEKNINVTATMLVNALNSKFHTLGIKETSTRTLSFKTTYSKNFSECTTGYIPTRNARYFLVIDCEGVSSSNGSLQNGFREIGVLLCAEYRGNYICRYEFQSDNRIFSDFIESFYVRYREITNSSVPKSGLDVYVYGASDGVMIKGEIEHIKSKRLRGMAEHLFNFVDTKYMINKVLDKDNMSSKRTIQNIARHFNVTAVRPKHSAVADARTLFNILTEIHRRETLDGQ